MERPASGRILRYLREAYGRKREDVTRVLAWLSDRLLTRYERGENVPSREQMEEIVGTFGCPPEAIDVMALAEEVISPGGRQEPPSPVALTQDERREIDRTRMAMACAVAGKLDPVLRRRKMRVKAAAQRAEAAEQLERLRPMPPAERRRLVAAFREYRTWALAEAASHESERRAADEAGEALEWARFGVFVADRIEGEESFRRRVIAYCLFFLANAERVANRFDAADRTLARAFELWQAGADVDPPLLSAWRPLDLAASLRRAQHRFAEALELLDRARTASGGNREAAGRILLKKEHVLEQAGDSAGALAVLNEAAPFVEASRVPRLLFLHRHKTALNLWHLGRYAEAAERLPEVRELAIGQANKLDLVRVQWLGARVKAALGETREAMADLEQVRRAFASHEPPLPYDAALSSLDLAVLWLEEGRTAEVRRLALEMAWIFDAQGIAREALASLALFCEAARDEVATVELARQVAAEIERARRSAPRPAGGARGRG